MERVRADMVIRENITSTYLRYYAPSFLANLGIGCIGFMSFIEIETLQALQVSFSAPPCSQNIGTFPTDSWPK
ncbi:hypothetical protein L218DRAFT_101913 [Marasmius fiardii PR-910]|nr:hypothetical protein L218DRAFT_101913 [Marasmius fiardii PR-910]